jgi:hypothetical protein
MACLGLHLALTDEVARGLLSLQSDDDIVNRIHELEEQYVPDDGEPEWSYASEKAWDAIHRCMSGGSLRSGEGPLAKLVKAWGVIRSCTTGGSLRIGEGPLAKLVLGGRQLHQGDEYIVSAITPAEAMEAAAAAYKIDKPDMKQRYDRMAPDYQKELVSIDDFEDTWQHFQSLREFLDRAGRSGRWVVFSVDQ